jgi:hypothetical protein
LIDSIDVIFSPHCVCDSARLRVPCSVVPTLPRRVS